MKFSRWLLAVATLLATVSTVPLNAAAARDKVDDQVRKQATLSGSSGGIPVLITRRSTSGALDTLKAHNAKIKAELEIGNIVAATVAPGDLSAIASDPDVVRIAYDAPMQAQAVIDPLTLLNLQTVYPLAVQASDAWNGLQPLRGTGVGLAVIDSGIDHSNMDFQNGSTSNSRIVTTQEYLTNSTGNLSDDNGHGTWVSSIAAGRGWATGTSQSEGQYVGIAPDANLIDVKSADVNGQSRTSDIINALQWVVNNQAAYNIRVVNISSVSSVAESYTTSALDAAVEMAWLHGIVVVVAAGNGGPNTSLYAPGNDPFVITVGATNDMGTPSTSDDHLAFFSSYGTTQDGFTKPELVAPGRHIVGSLASGGVTLANLYPNNIVGPSGRYISLSGTSGSAPIVAGVVADLLQARPNLRPDEVKGLLRQTALPVPGVGTGAGYPQLLNAVNTPLPITRADVRLVPNNYIASAGCQTLPTGTNCSQANWGAVSWDAVSWNSVSWNSVSWNSVSWNSVSWNSVSWNSVANQ